MIRISVWHGDMSDSYLRKMVQLGADCLPNGHRRGSQYGIQKSESES